MDVCNIDGGSVDVYHSIPCTAVQLEMGQVCSGQPLSRLQR